ncbi:MAG TPA: isoleucine--tRNA ligase [Paludibacteraceae bacterium]|nr:isoleucine--tRNA ligase [Paludibacteraceae bacterium]
MNTKFSEYTHLDLSAINKDILAYWDKHDIFKKSIDTRTGNPTFVFYEGPPSANGMPGIHHVMARTIKDLFLRYKTMKGYQVQRKAGWDTHGLPVELGVEKSLGITKEDIGKSISVEEYNAACRKDVMKYTKEWESLTHKMGYWVDMNHPYITYDNKFIESIWWLLKELYNKNLLYKGYTIQPYSPAAGSGLSSHELNQPGCYKDVKDTTVVAQFEIDNPIAELTQFGKAYFLAWTTTPWTLPSNTALCVGATITYVAVQTYNPYTFEPQTVILAKDLVSAHFNGKASSLSLSEYTAGDKLIPYSIIAEYKGSELVGMTYKQLIPFFKPDEGAFSVISGDFVTTEDGTGIVHIAPTFGADDARVAKMNNIPAMLLIDKNGNERPLVDLQGKFYTINDIDNDFVAQRTNIALYSPFAGRYVKNAYDTSLNENDATLDIDLCVMLKQQGLAFKIEKHIHNYPHCWRTDKPVLYYPLDSWFIRSTACRETMVELNNTINWKPQATGTGRFGKWLENLQDWNLSRSRYWGTPLPIWRTEDKQEEICIGSIAELMAEIEKAIQAGMMNENPFKDFVVNDFSEDNYGISRIDLHRPYVDNIILVSPSGKPMKRETDLIDVWFDSGAMPYAQLHYPFENKELIDKQTNFPADFISEGVDQTRGWFFTLHAISTMIKGSVAFKNVVSNGLVLDKNGNKMSKRLGNAVDPFSTIETYGSDALRWYMMTNASPWDNLKFDTEGIEEVKRKLFGTLYNTYSFFVLYANVDGFAYKEPEVPMEQRQEIDRWIISLLHSLVKEVDENYADYEPTRAGRAITTFVTDNLSNWYVRLNRRRYWAGEMTLDKLAAYQTLYTCLETVAKLMAPIAPFFAERLFLDLNSVTQKDISESIHLAQFPTFSESLINKQLEERMFIAQTITSLVLALRKKVNLKVRQPLSSIMIPVLDNNMKEDIEAVKELILNEVNVKSIQFVDNSAGILVKRIKADFKKLGPKCGKHMKQVSTLLQEMSQPQIAEFEKIGNYTLSVENNVNITISTQDVEIISEDIPGWLVANEGKITIALDITLTDELKEEGIARELVNRIQNIRKANGFDITDRISIVIEKNPLFNQAIENYKQYIASQTLAKSIEISDKINNGIELEFENDKLYLLIQKTA